MKTYVLMISRTFPATHPRKGEQTYFVDKILKQYSDFNNFLGWQKIHTIRGNFKLWAKRIKAIQEGKAILSLRYWSGSPYNFKKDGSKQIEFARLDKDSGIGLQFLSFDVPYGDFATSDTESDSYSINPNTFDLLAKNDGLTKEDLKSWFANSWYCDKKAIIHFTPFRY